MKIIALEEAFSMHGLRLGDKIHAVPDVNASEEFKSFTGPRLFDFTKWRLPDMDEYGVDVQVLSLTAPGIKWQILQKWRSVTREQRTIFYIMSLNSHRTVFAALLRFQCRIQ